jgi:hypothetical protein
MIVDFFGMVQVCQKVVLIIYWVKIESEHAQVLSGDVELD